MNDVSLNIPSKTLEDNFKLADFQKDFSSLLEVMLGVIAKPKVMNITSNSMTVTFENNVSKSFLIERNIQGKIAKITNTTDKKVLDINWEGL